MYTNQSPSPMQQVPHPALDAGTLPALSALRVRTDLPTAQRLEQFAREAGDPYHYRCGPVEVQVEFAPSGQPLQQQLEQLLTGLKARPSCAP